MDRSELQYITLCILREKLSATEISSGGLEESGQPERHTLQMIKPYVQSLLRRVGLYNRLKASCLYDLYWRFADKRMLDGRSREVKFYRNLLEGFRNGDLIFDIGANHGHKTDIFLRVGARVLAVDPDKVNQEALKDKFLRYRWGRKPVI